jgi:hypothetical protein
VLAVVRFLDRPAALGFLDREPHRIRDGIGVHDRAPVHVARRPADGLNQRSAGTQEPFLVRIEDRDERHLGQIESLTQEVDPDEHVEFAAPEVPQNLDSLECIDVRV